MARFIQVCVHGGDIKFINMDLISSIEIILDSFEISEERKGFSYSYVSINICFLNQKGYSNIRGLIAFNADEINYLEDFGLLIKCAITEL